MSSGIVLINKPLDITSRETLFQVQEKMNLPKMGHTGTLDPLATGLLVLLAGHAIKIQQILTLHDKEYEVCICLGANSDTDDSAGNIEKYPVEKEPCMEEIKKIVATFVGEIEQVPPKYSSIRINGKRAHSLARKGKDFTIPARKVKIEKIKITSYCYPHLELTVECGSGTYIRSLARDIGEKLATGGYVQRLHRTKVGSFSIDQAYSVGQVNTSSILPVENAITHYNRIEITAKDWERIRTGQKLDFATPETVDQPAFLWCNNKVIAVAKIREDKISAERLLVDNVPAL